MMVIRRMILQDYDAADKLMQHLHDMHFEFVDKELVHLNGKQKTILVPFVVLLLHNGTIV